MKAKELMIGDWVLVNRNDCVADCGHYLEWIEVGRIMRLENGIITVLYSDNEETDTIDWAEESEEDVKPYPITPEILEKNGWTYNNDDEKFSPQTWVDGGLMLQDADDGGYRIVVTSDYDDEDTNNTPFVILYVHELQHALKLRRIKKEIVL